MLQSLRVVYVTPSQSREAGYLELAHFGTGIRGHYSRYDLSGVPQRRLRNLLWDCLAHLLRTPGSPRTKGPYDDMRRACLELSAYLEFGAEEGGHDPTLLRGEHVHRFLADQRHRARNGLPSPAVRVRTGKPSTRQGIGGCGMLPRRPTPAASGERLSVRGGRTPLGRGWSPRRWRQAKLR
jgi:hypothetical protein